MEPPRIKSHDSLSLSPLKAKTNSLRKINTKNLNSSYISIHYDISNLLVLENGCKRGLKEPTITRVKVQRIKIVVKVNNKPVSLKINSGAAVRNFSKILF